MQNSTLLRLTNGESSTASRDEIDYNFDLTLDDEMHIEEEQQQMLLRRSTRSSHTPFDDRSNSVGNGSEADFMAEEVTESFDERDDSTTDNDDDDDDYNEGDEFDVMVTRGRAKRQTNRSAGKKPAKPAKKEKATTKPSSATTRQNRTTRAASVRF